MPAGVSVCLPVFNGEQFLKSAIESVLCQTYADFELLISDDCSQDSSLKIIQQFASQDARIKFWSNETNQGLFQNYNLCLAEATANLIKPFSQDDLLHPQMLEKMVRVANARPSVLLISAARSWIDEAGQDLSWQMDSLSASDIMPSNSRVPGTEVIQKSLYPVVNFIGEPSTVLFRKSSMMHGFDPSFHQLGDLDYWLRILRGGEYFYIDEVLASFRRHKHSQTSGNARGLMYLPDTLKLGHKFKEELSACGISEEHFIRRATESVAELVRNQFSDELTTIDHLRSREDYLALAIGTTSLSELSGDKLEQLVSDLLGFREIAAHALSLDWWRKLEEEARTRQALAQAAQTYEQNLQLIESLENRLQSLLSSKSWHFTKSARDINARIGRFNVSSRLDDFTLMADKDKKIDEHNEYIKDLRREVRRILRSRSWKLTRPLRDLGLDSEIQEQEPKKQHQKLTTGSRVVD